MNLQGVDSRARWSPRADSPPSRMDRRRIFACGEGIYLLTNPNFGEGDPVRAVGWAESDYWAKRVWETPFSGRKHSRPCRRFGGGSMTWRAGLVARPFS